MNNQDTLAKQNTTAIFLTNAMCEDTEHAGADVMMALGLSFGSMQLKGRRWVINTVDNPYPPQKGTYYPLTKEEGEFIGDDSIAMPSGYVALLGYSMLYKGQKWIAPDVEYSWTLDGDKDDKDEAEKAWDSLMADSKIITPRVKVGGEVDIVKFAYDDRHEMTIRLPVKTLLDRFYTPLQASGKPIRHGQVFKAYRKWLASLLRPQSDVR